MKKNLKQRHQLVCLMVFTIKQYMNGMLSSPGNFLESRKMMEYTMSMVHSVEIYIHESKKIYK